MRDPRRTWFIDFDGTLVLQKSHLSEHDYILPGTKDFFENIVEKDDFVIITTAREENEHKERIAKFLSTHNIRYDLILCGLPTGPRIVVNDKKPDGQITAYSYNLDRDMGINSQDYRELNNANRKK